MTTRPIEESHSVRKIDEGFLFKVFIAFAALAAFSALLSIGGKWIGRTISLAGHTEDQSLREIVIGNNVLSVPANAIRFPDDRRDGVMSNLRIYLRWPDMKGYTADSRDAFNHADGSRDILFLSFEQRMMSRDMSGRLEPIYRALTRPEGQAGTAGLTMHAFTTKSGYTDEMLVIGPAEGGTRFVARCLTGPVAQESLADCERDIFVGDDLALVYRFPSRLLAEWRRLDAAIAAFAAETIKTGA